MEEDLEVFIDNRINNNYNLLTKSKKWKETSEDYNIAYKQLYQKLTEEQRKELEHLISIKNILLGYESSLAYQLGRNDTIKMQKHIFIF